MWFLNKLLSLTWIGDFIASINGNKTYLGILALLMHIVGAVPQLFPDMGLSPELAASIDGWLRAIGITLLPIGVGHKITKKAVGE